MCYQKFVPFQSPFRDRKPKGIPQDVKWFIPSVEREDFQNVPSEICPIPITV